MKLIIKLIKVALFFGVIIGLFFLFINKTFIYEVYKTDVMTGDGIKIQRFMYLVKEDNALNANFITPLNESSLKTYRDNYFNSLTKCYDRYYYDEANNITITKYDIIDNGMYRKVNISYVSDNYCSEDYVLSDMWVYEYTNYSNYVSGDITSRAVTDLITKIYNSSRVNDPKITDYDSKTLITIICKIGSEAYELEFKDFSENEIAVTKKFKGVDSLAVYNINDAATYLDSLEKSIN